jgi:hypothetical protein
MESVQPIPLVIIGADAYLAARPATPVQVDHACRAAGYAAVIPATWGDELLATACARKLETRTVPSGIFCSCQRVRDRLLGPGPDLVPFLMSFVAPPVATARYLRRLYADMPIEITYVGNCPSANSDPDIARQVRPEDFFTALTARGIVAAREPLVFNSFFAPDRRRAVSLPGGLPIDRVLQEPLEPVEAKDPSPKDVSAPVLSTEDAPTPKANGTSPLPLVPRSVVSIRDVEYAPELAQYLIMAEPVLLDIAPRLGCACSGAVSGVPVADARAAVMALEPPRSPGPVVDIHVELDLELPIEVSEPALADVEPPAPTPSLDDLWPADPAPVPAVADRAVETPVIRADAPKPANAEPSDTAPASWLASCALAASDQPPPPGVPTSPSSSRSPAGADRGAGVP